MSEDSNNEIKGLLKIIIFMAVIILFVITNPKKESHDHEIKNMITRQDEFLGSFGGGWIATKMVNYHSYGVFSITKFEDSIVTIGFLGMVFPVE